ncbi:DUF2892 domain-containing protein [Chitinophagaceae bacterium 26-R-25]|nr:DUF2892 domain-containing protein [Chitinophagaceae bacterium 26-R-25]
MKKNMGLIDRMIRLLVAMLFVALYVMGLVTGVFGAFLIAVSIVFIATSLIGYCPVYDVFHIKTCK